MNDDALPLRTVWISDRSETNQDVFATMDAVLARDRALRSHDRRLRIASVLGLAFLVPVLLWAGAHGVTPLIRAAYAMMAVGCGAIVAAEWLYLEWSRQALPGPTDAQSQLRITAFMLGRQARLMNIAALWSSPIFLGVMLIAAWMYQQRTHAGALVLGVVTVGAWIAAGLSAWSVSARIDNRRHEMERLLNELG